MIAFKLSDFLGNFAVNSILKWLAASLVLSWPSLGIAQDAVNIDANGNVTIPGDVTAGNIAVNGTLTAQNVQAGNLDQTLKDLAAQNSKILSGLEWVVYADTLGNAMQRIIADPAAETTKYEFMMYRNAGMRQLHFSGWNQSDKRLLAMTDPYMTGDAAPFHMGGSMWVFAQSGFGHTCPAGQSYHLYYFSSATGFQSGWGNDCTSEGQV